MSTVAGRYFIDKNGTNVEDSSDIGIPGATVYLYQGSNLVATTRTDSSGNYRFSDVDQGYHYVKFSKSEYGSQFARTGVGRDERLDSDVWKTDGSGAGISGSFYVGRGSYVSDIDAAIVPSSNTSVTQTRASDGKGVVKGQYFYDNNRSDKQDGGDSGVSGATVRLIKDGRVVATSKTDGSGNYQFTGLEDGGYSVEFGSVNGASFARTNVGSNDAVDSDVWKTNSNGTGVSSQVVIKNGNTVSDVDAGLHSAKHAEERSPEPSPIKLSEDGTLKGRYFFDRNGSASEDGGDSGVSGATVRLMQSGKVIATTKTNGNGDYSFDNLPDGWYGVEFDLISSAYKFTRGNATSDTVDSDVWTTSNNDGRTTSFQVKNGSTVSNVDAGLLSKTSVEPVPTPVPAKSAGSLEGRYFWDRDGSDTENGGDSGLSGAQVRLLQNGKVVATSKTDGNGKYKFSDLDDGWYAVQFAKPGGSNDFARTNAGGNDANDSDVWKDSGGFGLTGNYEVKNGSSVSNVDAGIKSKQTTPTPEPVEVVVKNGAIAGRFFYDEDSDGIEDSSDSAVSGATVRLTQSGRTVTTTKTDGNGNYKFSGLEDGGYRVEFQLPSSSYEFTRTNTGGNDSIDSDVWKTSGNWGEADYRDVSGGKSFYNTDAGIVVKNAPTPDPTPTPTPTPKPTPTPQSGEKEMSILFVGNSYTYFAPNGDKSESPEGHFLAMLDVAGYDVTYQSAYIGGSPLKKLWDTSDAQRIIKSGDIDLVVLQGSNKNIESTSGVAEFKNYADKFTDLADANGAETVFYGIWAGDWQIDVRGGDTFSPEAHDVYRSTASANNAYYAPNGLAMASAHAELSKRYGDNGEKAEAILTVDAIHADSMGAYLAANVLFETLMNEDAPDTSEYRPGGVSTADARLMQDIADDVASRYAIDANQNDWIG